LKIYMTSWISSVVFEPSSWDRIKDEGASLTWELDMARNSIR
jgi:hypothetical protein